MVAFSLHTALVAALAVNTLALPSQPVPELDERSSPQVLLPFKGTLPSTNTSTLDRRINGPDNRYPYNNPGAFPWRTVGILWLTTNIGKTEYCTATLIGPTEILTAWHCSFGKDKSFSFWPAWNNGPAPGNPWAAVIRIDRATYPASQNLGCNFQEDYAVMTLDRDLGSAYGWMGIQVPSSSRFDKGIFTSLGYPSDGLSMREDYISLPGYGSPYCQQYYCRQFSCNSQGPILSNQDGGPGQSGAPLWVDGGNIWGVVGGAVSGSQPNQDVVRLASGSNMINLALSVKRANGH